MLVIGPQTASLGTGIIGARLDAAAGGGLLSSVATKVVVLSERMTEGMYKVVLPPSSKVTKVSTVVVPIVAVVVIATGER